MLDTRVASSLQPVQTPEPTPAAAPPAPTANAPAASPAAPAALAAQQTTTGFDAPQAGNPPAASSPSSDPSKTATPTANDAKGAWNNAAGWFAPKEFGQKLPPVTTIQQANQTFVDQLGGTPFNTDTQSTGYLDCGPSSAVMALAKLGLVNRPTGGTAEGEILNQRDRMHGANSPTLGTTWSQMQSGLASRGAITRELPENLSSIDTALANGHPVIIGGDPNNAWGPKLTSFNAYLEPSSDFGHFCTVMGKTPDGNYIVSDPLSSVGSITVTGQDLKNYWNNNLFTGALEVSRK